MNKVKSILLAVLSAIILCTPLVALMAYVSTDIETLVPVGAEVRPLDSVDYGNPVFNGSTVYAPAFQKVLPMVDDYKDVFISNTFGISFNFSIVNNVAHISPSVYCLPVMFIDNGGVLLSTTYRKVNKPDYSNFYMNGIDDFNLPSFDFLPDTYNNFWASFENISLTVPTYKVIEYFDFCFFFDSGFDVSNVVKCSYGSYRANSLWHHYFNSFSSTGVFLLRYFDKNDKMVEFGFPCLNATVLPPRTYVFDSVVENLDGYQQGYQTGYDVGIGDGKTLGYNSGYSAGNKVGYQNGYNVGLTDSKEYTFLGLIGAVVDAPINAFMSLLNFEVLGFNMLSAITGLFTFAILLVVVRLITGKGSGG